MQSSTTTATTPHPPRSPVVPGNPEFYQFLLSCKVERGCDYTHTSLMRPAAALYIPARAMPEFFELYRKAMLRDEDLFITERHRFIGPVVVDLDLRFASCRPAGTRSYSPRFLEDIATATARCIAEFVDVSGGDFDVLVLEKPPPDASSDRDGVHIVVPGIVTRPSVRYLIREALLQDPGFVAAIAALPGVTNPLADIVDEAVVERNGWMMHGSRKPRGFKYGLSRVYRTQGDVLRTTPRDVTDEFRKTVTECDLVELLSVRNKHTETPVRPDRVSTVAAKQTSMDEARRRREAVRTVFEAPDTDSNGASSALCRSSSICENIDAVRRLVELLKPARAETYIDWLRVGWCLRNIDTRLLAEWRDFSSRSPKYVDGECERLWRSMRRAGLGIGTLHMWARQDSPDAYFELMRCGLTELIHRSLSGAHHDVAQVVYHLYRYDFVCTSIRARTWYEFRDHRWRKNDMAYTLRRRLSVDVFNEYQKAAIEQQQRVIRTDDEGEQKNHIKSVNLINAISTKLKVTAFKDNVIKECCELFYREGFEELLDNNQCLLGFENGVYDLESLEFREGRPDDYVSFSTGINYSEFAQDHPVAVEMRRFWEQVQPQKELREYLLTLLSTALCGQTKEERFHIWTGTGSNGKSMCVELVEHSMGDYCCKLPVTLLTQKRASSNAATSEVARTKGKRFAVLQEPSEDERLNIGLMKELTGGDKIMARALYRDPIEFKPQFKMVLLCNHLPNVPSDDGGTWRRIRVLEFNSKFVENPCRPNEFPIDLELSQKFDAWREPLIAMLIEYYKQYARRGRMDEPDAVRACTREYQKNNDHYADFVDTCLERRADADTFTSCADIFNRFKSWVSEDNIPLKTPRKKDVEKALARHIGKPVVSRGTNGFRDYAIRQSMPTIEELVGDAFDFSLID